MFEKKIDEALDALEGAKEFATNRIIMSVKFNVKGNEIVVNCGNPEALFRAVEFMKKEGEKRFTEGNIKYQLEII